MSPGLLIQPTPGIQGSMDALSQSLSSAPHGLLNPSEKTHFAALACAKKYLDPLARSTSHYQQHRIDDSRRKRKRGQYDNGEVEWSALKLQEVYLDGFTVDGIWGQSRRILEASGGEVALRERQLEGAFEAQAQPKTVRFDEGGFEQLSDEDNDDDDDGDDDDEAEDDDGDEADFDGHGSEISEADDDESDLDLEALEAQGQVSMEPDDEQREGGELDEDFEDGEDIEADSDDEVDGPGLHRSKRSGTYIKDKNGLNDGFFDIDEFNKDTEFLEQADERGEDDGAASDEEDVDWDMNPLSQAAPAPDTSSKKQIKNQAPNSGDESDGDEEGGPTFGNADLDAPWSDDDEEMADAEVADEDTGMDNTNEVQYEDFFEPPPRALTKTNRRRALPKTQPQDRPVQPNNDDVQRAIDSHRRDLFDDEFSEAGEEDNVEIDEDTPGMRNLSTHERRQLMLAKQIRELETAAVSKREWQMSGEATAHVRPENALLEEDLEFERAGKPVPVITAEISTSIEEMIKQRILDRQFDEVIKRRPGADVGSALGRGQPRRGLVELSDQKDPVSLAESYEQAYLAQNDPNAKDARTEAEKAAHSEIEQLWGKVSHELDSLASLHFKPKPAKIEIRTVTDAPKILMEDARPSGVEGISEEQGGLAPQEVYRVGEDRQSGDEGVVTTKAGGVVAREELTKEQKLRRRRREKTKSRKQEASKAADKAQAANASAKADAVPIRKSRRDEETEVLKQLKAGGVQVIGKGGKLEDVDSGRS